MLKKYKNLIYLEATLDDPDELARTAIEDCNQVVLLNWYNSESSIQDSAIIPIVRLIEDNFKKVKMTVELIDQDNIKHMKYRPEKN